ncbi:MAG: tetratricopeptide (TPR) repeat protein [Planctomycetota bacterium]|jgi:tetratricopeptide (TPR) repeat protein
MRVRLLLEICAAALLAAAGAIAQAGTQDQGKQGEAALLAAFDRLQTAAQSAPQETQPGLLLQLSDTFLRLPAGDGRKQRLPAGAHATLHSGRTEIALQLASPKDGELQTNNVLLTVQMQALARLGRLAEFARILNNQATTAPDACADALRYEEGRLLPLAAMALRTPDRPAGRAVFQYLATLEPIQSYRVANLGLCLRQIGDVPAAFKTYALGQKLAPNDLALWNDYGLLLRATGRLEEALSAFRRSVAIDLRRDESQRGQGPAITNLMHFESLRPGAAGADPMPTARMALEKRPHATLLRRLTLDVTLDRLAATRVDAKTTAAKGAVVDKATHR